MLIYGKEIMMTPAIVVIGYNRPDSLKRILASIENAFYPEGVNPTLVISLDKCDVSDTAVAAREFVYTHGEKRVVERPERMGLKNHVLACGEFAAEYDGIIVLEDDLFVSPSFYVYAQNALEFTKDDERIGGVSLYNHLFNVHVRESFCAIDDGFDNWYFQLASSWGQAYTKNQWDSFMKWYREYTADEADSKSDGANSSSSSNGKMKSNPYVPANVSGWSDKSWLKFYITYLIETDKYFLYPRVSYTTNFGDVGSHMDKPDTDLQVPISCKRGNISFYFSTLDESNSVYDSFFENCRIEDTICDLYGIKPISKMLKNESRYILSSQVLSYKVVKSYGRQMRPHDANVIYDVPGCNFYLYEISDSAENSDETTVKKSSETMVKNAEKWFYQYRGISASQMIQMLKYRVREKFVSGKK